MAATERNQWLNFAVAVRDGSILRLFATVRRKPKNDVYVNFHQDYLPDSKPHTSYHASGQHHQKSFGKPYHVCVDQPPDQNFNGARNLVTTGITIADVRTIDRICDPSAFEKVCEIPLSNLRPELPTLTRGCGIGSTLSFDLVEPGCPAIINAGSRIIQEAIFDDSIPWIRITLFDPRP